MTTNQYDALEERVAQLQETLNALIENLADNNESLFEALFVLADSSKTSQQKKDAVDECHGGICTKDPPGCRKKKKDRD